MYCPYMRRGLDPIVLRNGEALHKILLKAKDRLRGVFYGHIHENTVDRA